MTINGQPWPFLPTIPRQWPDEVRADDLDGLPLCSRCVDRRCEKCLDRPLHRVAWGHERRTCGCGCQVLPGDPRWTEVLT